MLTLLVPLATSCNDEWTEEQYEHYASFRSPLNNQGVTEIYVPYTRKNNDDGNSYSGRSSYKLPVIISGSLTNDMNYDIHFAADPDTLETINIARYQQRKDLWYTDLSQEGIKHVRIPESLSISAGQDVGLLEIGFDFRGIDMADKWVLPITIVDNPEYGYQSHPRKNYAKAILRVYPYNDYSGIYSATLMNCYLASENPDPKLAEQEEIANGAMVANESKGYVVDDKSIFFYAGIIDEDRTDRKNYKIYCTFNGETSGSVSFRCDNPKVEFKSMKEASFRISEEMDATRPYLKRRYLIINNIDYYFSDYTSLPGTPIRYHVKGSLSLLRTINTQVPDEDQAIEW